MPCRKCYVVAPIEGAFVSDVGECLGCKFDSDVSTLKFVPLVYGVEIGFLLELLSTKYHTEVAQDPYNYRLKCTLSAFPQMVLSLKYLK